ncbi:MAG TPA: hypothetical protein VHU23_13225 [Rhizomicrobium sp.]|jgi:hypothetical protein|nr:hypothetical protein [Rhizomicrobium sp.]
MSYDQRLEVYHQDCEFYRHLDKSKWGRFQTASVAQGAVVYAVFEINKFSSVERLWIAVGGAVFVLTICAIAMVDARDAGIYLSRIIAFEQPTVRWPAKSQFKWGRLLLKVQISLAAILNCFIVLKLLGNYLGRIP